MSQQHHVQRQALSLSGGVVSGILAFALAFLVTRGAASDWLILIICAPLGTLVVATVGFWLLLGLGHRLRVWMGVVAGLILGCGRMRRRGTWLSSLPISLACVRLWATRRWICSRACGHAGCMPPAACSWWVSVPVSAIAGALFV